MIKLPLSLYFHIPFCESRCAYCRFYSTSPDDRLIDQFVHQLLLEIDYYSALISSYRVKAIYFGGGTPSLLPVKSLRSILTRLQSIASVNKLTELSLELNPASTTLSKLIAYRQLGFNRLSFGVQSFNVSTLKHMRRHYRPVKAINLIKQAHQLGFKHLSLDLITHYVTQTEQEMITNLNKALSLPINHLSMYRYELPEHTNGYDRDLIIDQKLDQILKRSPFNRYEISNYSSSPTHVCLYSSLFWHSHDYLGFGPSAESFIHNSSIQNPASLTNYLQPHFLSEKIIQSYSPKELIERFIVLGLRLKEGIDLNEFKTKFQLDLVNTFSDAINHLLQQKLVTLTATRLKLTSPGRALTDSITEYLLHHSI